MAENGNRPQSLQMACTDGNSALVQLRTRALFNLPKEYEHVRIETSAGTLKWSSNTVSVLPGSGTAVVEYWARVPADPKRTTTVQLEVGSLGAAPSPAHARCARTHAWTY
jgi:hypothetical protein